MSSSYRRLQVEVAGNVGGFMAAMNQVLAGTTRVGQGFRNNARDAGLLNKQLLAIGTTARYALAGSLVFGVTGALQKLGDFRAELGVIDALAGQIDKRGNFQSLGQQLEDVGSSSILMSNKFGVAVGDIEAYAQRFYSAFNVGTGARALKSMEAFVSRAASLQTQFGREAGDPQQLAGGLASFVNQVPGGKKDIAGTTRLAANLISNMLTKTPNVTGRDISRDIARVGGAMLAANMTPEQVFAVYGTAGLAGGSASVLGRGVDQLLSRSLLNPRSPKQLAAFSSMGLPTDPNMLRSMGGMAVLTQMMRSIGNPAGLRGLSRMAGDENTSDADFTAAAGRKGIDVAKLLNAFGRIESVRQFVNILGQGGVAALEKWMKTQEKAIKIDEQKQRSGAAVDQRTLIRMREARANLGMSLVGTASWPIEHLIADPIIGLSNQAAKHKTATQVAVGGALAIGAASALGRLTGRGGKLLSRLSGAQRGLIGGALSAEAIPAALEGGAADGSRGSPLWVIIHPLSWSVGSPGGLAQPIGGGYGPPMARGKFSVPPVLMGALGPAAVATAVLALGGSGGPVKTKRGKDGRLILDNLNQGYSFAQRGIPELADPFMQAMRFAGMDNAKGLQRVEFSGQANADLTIRLVDKSGKQIVVHEEKGVPIEMIPARQFPTAKGKPGTKKKGANR